MHRPFTLILFVILILMGLPGLSLGLDVGEKAPPFSADSTQGKVHLSDFHGEKNVVLALYFAVFTPV